MISQGLLNVKGPGRSRGESGETSEGTNVLFLALETLCGEPWPKDCGQPWKVESKSLEAPEAIPPHQQLGFRP